ncbi:MAG: RIP metalloprotease RseP [Candidatus Pacebacteria bacterium]|nr:RIP metalloprotease RseP [Candidatus Paceibacterota bacterium]
MDTVFTITTFVLVITVIVFIHELGHYMVARYNGVQVDVFSIGFGPELFAWVDKRGTRWRFAVILLGGYVKMLGDLDGASARSVDPKTLPANQRSRSLPSKSVGQRAAVAVAGPVYNLLFAMVVFFGLFAIYGKSSVIPKVSEVVAASPAEKAGLLAGDMIRSINGVETAEFSKVLELIQANGGKPLALQIVRQEKEMELSVTPVVVTTTDMIGRTHETAQIGVRFGEVAVTKLNPLESFWESGKEVTVITGQILVAVGDMVTGNKSPKEMAGLISIAKITGAAAKIGIAELLRFMALISINLGIVNLLPIPVLDGGHILLCGLEKLRGKPLTERFQNAVMVTGLVIVIGLMIFSNGNDIVNSLKGLMAQ